MRHGHFEVYIQKEPNDRFSYGPNPPQGGLTADIFRTKIPDVVSWNDAIKILGVTIQPTQVSPSVIRRPQNDPSSGRGPVEQAGPRREPTARDMLQLIPGLTPAAIDLMLKRYGTLRAIANATAADLVKLPGVDPDAAQLLTLVFNREER